MKNQRFGLDVLFSCAALAATLLTANASADESILSPVQYSKQVSYRSGGIGEDQSVAMKAEAAKYPLSLIFAARMDNHDVYASGVHVTIERSDRTQLLDVVSADPLMLVDLPYGKIKVTATYQGLTKTLPVLISANKHQQLVFEWVEAKPESALPSRID